MKARKQKEKNWWSTLTLSKSNIPFAELGPKLTCRPTTAVFFIIIGVGRQFQGRALRP